MFEWLDLTNCWRLCDNLVHEAEKKGSHEIPKWFSCQMDFKGNGLFEFNIEVLPNFKWENTGLALCVASEEKIDWEYEIRINEVLVPMDWTEFPRLSEMAHAQLMNSLRSLQCKKLKQQLVWPVFHKVDPSDVRYQKVIKYCHDMGVVHRDIKPENILLSKAGKIKLADFGLAMRISYGQNLTGLAGSPAYVAPEVLVGKYSEKVDIWSAGVLLHALLVGVLPFQGDSLEAVFESVKTVKLDFHTGIWESISKPARDLIGRMLTRDVSVRITADEVLRHPWILFYTERTLKALPIKSRSKNQAVPPHQLAIAPRLKAVLNKPEDGSLSETLSAPSSSGSCKSEQDDCGLVDALATAVSHVRISEPKRTRLCSPTGPIEQQCSSNMKANLCKAF
ncbi:hypothetical protein M0R45_027378 [Rubus argutus]|uniref:Protein kinase domain-containing protein n=1 Tax=Rubus argutus TaxID=59490 RepID=A0AAW1X0V9_RUBAR